MKDILLFIFYFILIFYNMNLLDGRIQRNKFGILYYWLIVTSQYIVNSQYINLNTQNIISI